MHGKRKPRTLKTERQRAQRRTARERQDAADLRQRYERADYPTRDDQPRYSHDRRNSSLRFCASWQIWQIACSTPTPPPP